MTRVDEPYLLCLVNLAHMGYPQYGLPSGLGVNLHNWTNTEVLLYLDEKRHSVPKSLYHHIRPRIILSVRLNKTSPPLGLRAVEVPQEVFQVLLFCRLNVHSRKCYGDIVKALLEDGLHRKTSR